MALDKDDILPLYRGSDESNRKITVEGLAAFVTDGLASSVIISADPPSPAEDGDLWYNTTDGRLYVYNGSWVDASPSLNGDDYVLKDDAGNPQAITGGGGLSVAGGFTSEFGTNTSQLGNVAPLNEWDVYPARA